MGTGAKFIRAVLQIERSLNGPYMWALSPSCALRFMYVLKPHVVHVNFLLIINRGSGYVLKGKYVLVSSGNIIHMSKF